jgi:hypothetical protein
MGGTNPYIGTTTPSYPTYPTWPSTGTGSSPLKAHFGYEETKREYPYIKKEKAVEQEYIVGNGKTTSFTFPTTENYPAVAVYSRAVEGEGDEQTVTVTQVTPTISIVQGENITVEFDEAPARRGAVILIG